MFFSDDIKELIIQLIFSFFIVFIMTTFIFQIFTIPSVSMKPNLLVGDVVFVSKWDYGYNVHSLPFGLGGYFSSSSNTYRFWSQSPARGDIVVFVLPTKSDQYYVKRVIGLPGDKIRLENGRVFVNDKILEVFKEEQEKFEYVEKNLNGDKYKILNLVDNSVFDNFSEIVIPEGKMFLLGDNRDRSSDSRSSFMGVVAQDNLVGRVRYVLYSVRNNIMLLGIIPNPKYIRAARYLKRVR